MIEAQGVFYDGVGAHRLFRGTEIEIVGLRPDHLSTRRELFQRTRCPLLGNSLLDVGLGQRGTRRPNVVRATLRWRRRFCGVKACRLL